MLLITLTKLFSSSIKTRNIKTIFTAFLLLISYCLTAIPANAQTNIQDSLALVDLYNSTNGPGWYKSSNWLTEKPVSKWYGVKVTHSRVTAINLAFNKLVGNLPSSLGNITNLSSLRLSGNS